MPPLCTYPLTDEVGMVLSCVTLSLLMGKGRYVGHLQCDIIIKAPTTWANLFGAGTLVMGDAIYSRDGNNFTEKA